MKLYSLAEEKDIPIIKWDGEDVTYNLLDSIFIGKVRGVFENSRELLISIRHGHIRVNVGEYIEVLNKEEFHVYNNKEFKKRFKEV